MSSRGSSSEEVLEFFEQELARAYLVVMTSSIREWLRSAALSFITRTS